MRTTLLTLLIAIPTLFISVHCQELVKDINNGGQSSYPDNLVSVNGTLFFSAFDAVSGYELWKSDGTDGGTVLVKDIVPGSLGSGPKFLTNVNGTLFFSATTAAGEDELWKSDGTSSGTVIVKDINPGQGNFNGSNPRNLIYINGILFFTANDGLSGAELWKSDGTVAGTVLVKDIYPGISNSDPQDLIDINGTLFFSADYNSTGRNLWKSDGTEAGTVLVKQICNTTNMPWTCCPYFKNVNGNLFFVPINNASNTTGSELWKSDGTEAGTVFVKNIRIGEGGSDKYFEVVNGLLYFRAKDDTNGEELWKSDGTSSGTILVNDINPGIASSYPAELAEYNGMLYFRANNGVNGSELWKSDGSIIGTNIVKDLYIGSGSGSPQLLLVFNNALFFKALNNSGVVTTWKTNGTDIGTTEHINSNLNYGLTNVAGQDISPAFAIVNNVLFYGMSSSGFGKELWKFEPTILGINESESVTDKLIIYPNPSSGIFNLINNTNSENLDLKIFNLQGQLIFESSKFVSEIDLSSQPKGIYIIQLKSQNEVFIEKAIFY